MSTATLEAMRGLPGLHEYMDELEGRLHEVVSVHGGLVSVVGEEALSAGGKRLRPLLVFLSTPNGEQPSIAAGVAVELVHMATLVHDDLIDGARLRRGRAAAWSTYGEAAARAAGDYLFARALRSPGRAGSPGPSRCSPAQPWRWLVGERCSAASSATRPRPSRATSSAAP